MLVLKLLSWTYIIGFIFFWVYSGSWAVALQWPLIPIFIILFKMAGL